MGERSFGICKAQPNQLSTSWKSVQGPMATAKVSKLRCRVSWFTHCAQRQLSLQSEICWLVLCYISCSMLSYAACERTHRSHNFDLGASISDFLHTMLPGRKKMCSYLQFCFKRRSRLSALENESLGARLETCCIESWSWDRRRGMPRNETTPATETQAEARAACSKKIEQSNSSYVKTVNSCYIPNSNTALQKESHGSSRNTSVRQELVRFH